MSFKQIPFDFGHSPSWDADDFLVSACNQDAVQKISAWPKWQGNGLYLYGSKGSGKTYLGEAWRKKSNAVVWPEVGQAIIVDGLKDVDEEKLFHTYNQLKETGGYLLVMEEVPLRQVDLKLKDLMSRLMTLPAAELLPPDDALLSAILIKQFHDRQVKVMPEIIAYILPRIERSGAAAIDLVAKLDAAALTLKKPITIPLVREVLAQAGDALK